MDWAPLAAWGRQGARRGEPSHRLRVLSVDRWKCRRILLSAASRALDQGCGAASVTVRSRLPVAPGGTARTATAGLAKASNGSGEDSRDGLRVNSFGGVLTVKHRSKSPGLHGP